MSDCFANAPVDGYGFTDEDYPEECPHCGSYCCNCAYEEMPTAEERYGCICEYLGKLDPDCVCDGTGDE